MKSKLFKIVFEIELNSRSRLFVLDQEASSFDEALDVGRGRIMDKFPNYQIINHTFI